MLRRPTPSALLAVLAALLCAAPAAHARVHHGACRPGDSAGPTCRVWHARVAGVNDGDTILVRFGHRRRIVPIRFSGIQAMELTRYDNFDFHKWRGQCHAVAAGKFVERLMRKAHWRVRLTTQGRGRTDSRGRPWRFIGVHYGGTWHDVAEAELARGLGLWMPQAGQTAWNTLDSLLVQKAAQRGIGMFDTTACGAGPDQEVPLRVLVQSDPLGDDPAHIDGEYVQVRNGSATQAVDLGGWWVRDSGHRQFTFPAGTVVAPGGRVTVHVGSGQDGGGDFYWGLRQTVFENSANGGGMGDGAYLFGPQGDLRAWMIYPCLTACTDPEQGAVQVIAHPIRREYVLLRNVGDHAVNLDGYEVAFPGAYPFGPDSVLQPGQVMEVDVEGSPSSDTALVRHAGIPGAMLSDAGGAVRLQTYDGIVLGCDAWGRGRC